MKKERGERDVEEETERRGRGAEGKRLGRKEREIQTEILR